MRLKSGSAVDLFWPRKRDPSPSAGLAAARKPSKNYGDGKRGPDERIDILELLVTVPLLAANDLLAPLPADLLQAQAQIAACGMRPIGTTGKSVKPVQPSSKKYSASRATQITAITPRISSTQGALATSRTRGEMRWTRMALADVDA